MNKSGFLLKKFLLYIIVSAFFLFLIFSYVVVWMPNVRLSGGERKVVLIPSGTDYRGVLDILKQDSVLRHPVTFDLLARRKHYPEFIHPGRYLFRQGMNNNMMINMLRGGFQQPVKVTIHNIRTKEQLAGLVAKRLELDSADLIHLLNDTAFVARFGMDTANVISLFIPDTYEFYWNIPAEHFVEKMYREYKKFWNRQRLKAAANIGLTPPEVITLASIVQEEVIHADEMPQIAGVYLNRLKKGIRLQADPTIKFALHDFDRRRIITKDLNIDSPYNTYKYAGLPPGPIRIPSKAAIDAVLHAEKSKYLYFCAKDDFSGYHYFSKTLTEHNHYARKYRRALNKKRIYR